MRIVAVDWSGRVAGERQAIWLAEVVDGALARLESGRTREEIAAHLVELAGEDAELVVGLDFAFSLPRWYLDELGIATGDELWARMACETLTPSMREIRLTKWLANPDPPFWRRAGGRAALQSDREFRRTERDVAQFRPKSVFQLVGAGQVGPASLRGMQTLHRLAGSGFNVWPFHEAALPLVVEIFPRVLTGRVVKSQPLARERYLDDRFPQLPAEKRRLAVKSEDAFDAAVSALVMAESVVELLNLPPSDDYRREGRIWQPRKPTAVDLGDAEGVPSLAASLELDDDAPPEICMFCAEEIDDRRFVCALAVRYEWEPAAVTHCVCHIWCLRSATRATGVF